MSDKNDNRDDAPRDDAEGGTQGDSEGRSEGGAQGGALEPTEISPPQNADHETAPAARENEQPREVYGEILDLKSLHAREVTQPDLAEFSSVRPYVIMGVMAALLLFGSMTVWSFTAPLAKGAIAPGKITVASNRKTIQHLEGGIVRAIHISNGDQVSEGDVLMELDSSRATANQSIQNKRLLTAMAQNARLSALNQGLETLSFPDSLLTAAEADPSLAALVETERQTFEAQRNTMTVRREILEEQIAQLEEQISGFRAQIDAFERQRSLIQEEIEDVGFLLEKGLVERPRLRALQRTEAGLTGEIDANRASIAQSQQRIAEAKLQMIEMEESEAERIKEELRVVQERMNELRSEIEAADDVVDRLQITAPQDGLIVDLQFHTIGGVVQPGQRIADLVPLQDELVISAQVMPQNVDSVAIGLPADVILSGLNQRTTPKLRGVVRNLSADILEDPRTGMPYYQASIAIPAEELERLPPGTVLTPGMPAETIIITGQRSAFSYLIQPIEEAARKGLVAE